jgi:hypothetical protein
MGDFSLTGRALLVKSSARALFCGVQIRSGRAAEKHRRDAARKGQPRTLTTEGFFAVAPLRDLKHNPRSFWAPVAPH